MSQQQSTESLDDLIDEDLVDEYSPEDDDWADTHQYGGEFEGYRGMLSFIHDVELHRAWMTYWHTHRDGDVINIDHLLDNGYTPLIENLFEKPIVSSRAASLAYRYIHSGIEAPRRIKNIPDEYVETIESLRSNDLGRLVVLDAQVTTLSSKYNRCWLASSQCAMCAETRFEVQGWETSKVIRPGSCTHENCSGAMQPAYTEDAYVTVQEAVLQDLPRRVHVATPDDISARLCDDLVKSVEPGEEVRVAAALMPDIDTDSAGGEMTPDFKLHVLGITSENDEVSALDIDENKREYYEELADRDDIHNVIAQSISPSLAETEAIRLGRQAAAYQIAGGVRMENNGAVKRGVIHNLFIGDPSTGKSTIAEYADDSAPRSEFVSGENVSRAGLTASIQSEERFDQTEYTLKPGALVRAHGGLAVLDELDKAPSKAVDGLHTPMSKQIVKVDKVIQGHLAAQTNVLAVANPTKQRFDPYDDLREQIDVDPALFSRFDIVIPFFDVVDENIDRASMQAYTFFEDDLDDDADLLSKQELREYFSLAQSYNPTLTTEASRYLADEFVDLRQQGDNEKMPVTKRQGDAIRRLAQASARLRFSETVELEDMERARDLMLASLQMVAIDEFGDLDADLLGAGPSASEREIMEICEEIVQGHFEAAGPVSLNKVQEVAKEQQDVPGHRIEAVLNKLVSKQSSPIWRNADGLGWSG